MKKDQELGDILISYWQRRKQERSGLSVRSAAKHLNISPSFLNEILHGKKQASPQILEKVLHFLGVESERRQSIWNLALKQKGFQSTLSARAKVNPTKLRSSLTEWKLENRKKMSSLRQWFYLAITDCLDIKSCDGTAKSISRLLNLSVHSVEVALRDLQQAGIVTVNKDGSYKKSNKKIRFADVISTPEIRKIHAQFMDRAKNTMETKIDRDSLDKRLITGMTFSVTKKRIPWAKERLLECLHEIANDLIDESDEADSVYHLGLQLIPVAES